VLQRKWDAPCLPTKRGTGERFFCSTCGCHIGDVSVTDDSLGQWNIATSVFPNHGPENFLIGTHCLTDQAPGGGIDRWLARIGGRDIKVWNPNADDPEWDTTPVTSTAERDAEGGERLRAACHCGGVSFTIPRPTVPAAAQSTHIQKYASPVDNNKWVATVDLCDDCRLATGTHLTAWTFVPRALLDPPIPTALEPYGTMKAYASSPGVLRGFCGTCGATVIFSCDEKTPSDEEAVVDVAAALLRAPEGVTAENWVTWRTGKVSWEKDGNKYDPDFSSAIQEGLKKWGEEKYGTVTNWPIGE
jgi:hypothetical protein